MGWPALAVLLLAPLLTQELRPRAPFPAVAPGPVAVVAGSSPWIPAVLPPAARAILARPLFAADRRPSAPPAAAAGRTRPPRLAGTVIGRGVRVAILVLDGATPAALREGEERVGWRVRTVAPGRVVLQGAGGQQVLVLASAPPAAAPPVAPPSPAILVMTKDPRSRAANNQDE